MKKNKKRDEMKDRGKEKKRKKRGGQTGKEMSEIGRRKKRVRLDEGRKLR